MINVSLPGQTGSESPVAEHSLSGNLVPGNQNTRYIALRTVWSRKGVKLLCPSDWTYNHMTFSGKKSKFLIKYEHRHCVPDPSFQSFK